MVKSHKRSSRRRHNKTKKGGSMLSSAALPIALVGLNTMFGKKSKKGSKKYGGRKSRRSRK